MSAKLITPFEIPNDFEYFRSNSDFERKYLISLNLKIVPQGKYFGWFKNYFNLCYIAKFDRIDEEPNLENLKRIGFGHGLVIWIPWRRKNIPKGWHYLPVSTHIRCSGFSVLDREYYWEKWSERGRRSRKKFLSNPKLVIKEVKDDLFYREFINSNLKRYLRKGLGKFYKEVNLIDSQKIKNWLCFNGDYILGGLAVLKYNNYSNVHLVSFLNKGGRKLQVGTGLIDKWFFESQRQGLKYLNFDYLGDKKDPRDWKGYSDFKKNFIDYIFCINKSYFKIL